MIIDQHRGNPYAVPFDKVALLLNFDGAHGSSVFTDSSSHNHTVNETGSGRLTTVTKKFGTAALGCTSTNYTLTVDDLPSLQFGAMNWTHEEWVRDAAVGGGFCKLNEWEVELEQVSGERKVRLRLGSSGVGYSVNELFPAASGHGYPSGAFFHLAVERFGDVVTVYVDGASIGSVAFSGAIADTGNPWRMGIMPSGSYFGNASFVDDLRMVIDHAVYKGPFTPPTAAHPDS